MTLGKFHILTSFNVLGLSGQRFEILIACQDDEKVVALVTGFDKCANGNTPVIRFRPN